MKRLLSLFFHLILLILTVSLSLYTALHYGFLVFGIYAFLILIAIVTPWFLTDLLVAWTELFSIVIASFMLTIGISYFQMWDRIILIFAFPLVLFAADQIEGFILEKKDAIAVQISKAKNYYEYYARKAKRSEDITIQTMLVRWAHAEQFKQTQPKEYYATIKRINRAILRSKYDSDRLFYLRNGLFLLVQTKSYPDWHLSLEEEISINLSRLRFNNESSMHEIQFQYAYQAINHKNWKRYAYYEDLIKRLERLLETHIIVEY
ncbi:hypothetical protein [Streptococcus macacae]|uniref:Uncharacterized protein n=1 Tax=Streptococcus macacae NCTC 11558 TaxID=764298 RepID=G5JVL8_9STRE|nr:hypothetical protein [Streptococcus macacae]EHJ52073.1 hypothetical protein STRMA_0874 [Streptococcus macacae NCTC 11558]SUN78686.1 Uncharacterised protein [Streptococcus macacae NCTC 11558]